MTVLITGMKMPGNCEDCDVRGLGQTWCPVTWQPIPQGEREKSCPLIEVPTPHGRLIDADALLAEAKRISGPITGDGWDNYGVYALIERQPTAMEAEEEVE